MLALLPMLTCIQPGKALMHPTRACLLVMLRQKQAALTLLTNQAARSPREQPVSHHGRHSVQAWAQGQTHAVQTKYVYSQDACQIAGTDSASRRAPVQGMMWRRPSTAEPW